MNIQRSAVTAYLALMAFLSPVVLFAEDGRKPPPFPPGFFEFSGPQQRRPDDLPPGLRGRMMLCNMSARIVENGDNVTWQSDDSRLTISGRPVVLKLVGDNVVMVLQFTPYVNTRNSGDMAEMSGVLVAQGQIWLNKSDGGIHHQAVMQTINFNLGEKFYFFPLGDQKKKDSSFIEILLELKPWTEESGTEN